VKATCRSRFPLLTTFDHSQSDEHTIGLLCCGSERWFLHPIVLRVRTGFELIRMTFNSPGFYQVRVDVPLLCSLLPLPPNDRHPRTPSGNSSYPRIISSSFGGVYLTYSHILYRDPWPSGSRTTRPNRNVRKRPRRKRHRAIRLVPRFPCPHRGHQRTTAGTYTSEGSRA